MVITLLSGSFITAFSETLLNNGFPTIMQEVHVSEMTVQWLSTGYMRCRGNNALGRLPDQYHQITAPFHHYNEPLFDWNYHCSRCPQFSDSLNWAPDRRGGRWCQYAPYSQRFVLDFFTPKPGNCYGISRDHH